MGQSHDNPPPAPGQPAAKAATKAPSLEQIYQRLQIEPQPMHPGAGGKERYVSTLGDARSAAARSKQSKLLHSRQQDNALFGMLEKFVRSGNEHDLEAAAAELSRLAGRKVSPEMLRQALDLEEYADPDSDSKAEEAKKQLLLVRGLKLPTRF